MGRIQGARGLDAVTGGETVRSLSTFWSTTPAGCLLRILDYQITSLALSATDGIKGQLNCAMRCHAHRPSCTHTIDWTVYGLGDTWKPSPAMQ